MPKTKTNKAWSVSLKPVGEMVLIFHDEELNKTAGGIILPDTAKETVLTGRIIAIPERMKNDSIEYPFDELDTVVYDIRHRIPVELNSGNRYYLVKAEYIYGVLQDQKQEQDQDE